MAKYNNVKIDGYDSKKEYRRAKELKLLEKKGIITGLQEQVKYELISPQYRFYEVQGVRKMLRKKKLIERGVYYIADFVYYRDGEYIVEDTKGVRTKEYIIKRKLMLYVHGIKIKEDFSKPKIVWKIIGNQMAFAYDANNYVMNNACYIMTGDHLDYLLAVLNSQAITWYSYVTNMNKTGVGDVQVGGQNIATFPIPFYDANKIELIELAELANSIINKNINLPFIDSKIEGLVSMIYGFTSEETNFLHSFVSSLRKSI